MIVSGTKQLAAPRSVVWSVINEPAEMAKLMPGVESFEIQDEKHWTAKVKVPLGLGGLKMTMNFEKLEEREPEFASMRAKGQGVGALMDMTTSFQLDEADGGGTDMTWDADVRIAGPVGSMGQRVLQPIVNQQVGNVLSALEKQVEEAAGGPAGQGESGGPAGQGGPTEAGGSSGSGEPAPAPAGGSQSEASGEAPSEAAPGGAEEGIHPASPETYSEDPEGPTHSTRDEG